VDIDREAVLETFAAECEESFASVEASLVALETQPGDRALIETIFRAMHTLKGNAHSLEFFHVSEFAHAVEDILAQLHNQRLLVTRDVITLLLAAVDALRAMLPEALAGAEELAPAQSRLCEALRRVALEGASAAGPVAPRHAEVPEEGRRRAPAARRRAERESFAGSARSLRVNAAKLDRMLDLTGEISIALGHLRQALEARAGAAREELLELFGSAEQMHRALQQQVMNVRMRPIGPTFRHFVRVVRDVAVAAGKLARLELEGEEVELDMGVIEQLRDPLTHMVRNAIDHGIEAPEAREAAGKDRCGRVRLRAWRDAGSIVVDVEDDGAGFQRERIALRARELGLVAEPEALPTQELYRLIFEPGFSTAERVTALSGRGVGMDVVLRRVEALHGSVRIASRPGAGSTVTLRLPLTLAIIDGLGVGAGGETFVLPLDDVIECVDLPPEQRSQAAARGVFDLRGDALPFVRLGDALGLPRDAGARESVVVVRREDTRAGIAVDRLYGQSQTVIKPLGGAFQGLPGIAGSAILGTGRVALILDVATLLRRIASPDERARASVRAQAV
jgi:two-component system chemotaxis sensor kinase CheA